MKALTLHEPWASLVASGDKVIETRSWDTSYRGPIAIHASKSKAFSDPNYWGRLWSLTGAEFPPRCPDFNFGCVIAVCSLAATYRIEGKCDVPMKDRCFGDFTEGRFAWCLLSVRRVRIPVAARGYQRLWEITDDLREQVYRTLAP